MTKRLAFLGALALLSACSESAGDEIDRAASEPSTAWTQADDHHLPWTVEAPDDWHMTFERSPPRANLKAGYLQSWIGTTGYRPGWPTGPNQAGGASEMLGRGAVMVHIGLLWSPPDESIPWSPDPTTSPTWRRDYGEHPDAQNPGWVFHERQLCQGEECVNVLIWHGPDASDDDVGDAQRVAESVAFVAGWTD